MLSDRILSGAQTLKIKASADFVFDELVYPFFTLNFNFIHGHAKKDLIHYNSISHYFTNN